MAKLTKRGADRERVGRIWTEFVVPFFNYPAHWVVDEARESFRGELNNVVVKCTCRKKREGRFARVRSLTDVPFYLQMLPASG